MGRIEEAREVIKEFVKNNPEYTLVDIRGIKFKYRPYIDKWAEDLRKAGLPE